MKSCLFTQRLELPASFKIIIVITRVLKPVELEDGFRPRGKSGYVPLYLQLPNYEILQKKKEKKIGLIWNVNILLLLLSASSYDSLFASSRNYN